MTRRAPRRRELGVTIPEYDAILEAQGGVCPISLFPPKNRRLDVDHDHKTMQVRGLLSHRANQLLEPWVTVDVLRRAIAYLEQPPAPAVLELLRSGDDASD